MTLTLEIPNDIAAGLVQDGKDPARAVLEDFCVEAYRQGRLSTLQIRRLLGHGSRWDTEDFLATHNAWPDPSESEVISGAAALRSLRPS
jgi:hypothetical protein